MSIARVSPTITTTTTDDDDAMAPTDVARVIPSRTSPDPAKLVKWTDKPTGCLSIAVWVAVAFVLQEFCVTRVSLIYTSIPATPVRDDVPLDVRDDVRSPLEVVCDVSRADAGDRDRRRSPRRVLTSSPVLSNSYSGWIGRARVRGYLRRRGARGPSRSRAVCASAWRSCTTPTRG